MEGAPEWLKEGLMKLDVDGDGLTREEVEDLLNWAAAHEARKRDVHGEAGEELDYTMFPQAVRDALSIWDEDKSGGEGLYYNHVHCFRRPCVTDALSICGNEDKSGGEGEQ
jgi:hypothetical protein